nr:integrase, catalytic region, zinc finger, CCHC-type, peptidase aspartic, catalytic [Tanacetum cinerariifolium]
MSQDVLTVSSTMRILLLYQGEYSQWVESNKTAKDLWDALARHMLGSKYGEQDRKAAVLYEYETFKATEGELLLDTYIRYLQVINDLKKCGYSKDNCELNFKFLNNLQPEWKQYETMRRQNKNLMDINIDALYNILKQNQGDVNDDMGLKKKNVVVTSDPLALIAKKTKVNKSKEKVVSSDSEGSGADDFSELKKITAMLEKAFNRRKFYSKPTNNNLRTSSTSQSANKIQEFIKTNDKKVEKKDDEKNSSSAEETIAEVAYYTSESESELEIETSEYYDNSTNYGLFVNNDDDQEIFHDAIESASENFIKNHIDSQKNYDKSKVDHNGSKEKEHLVDKLIRQFNHKIVKCQKHIEKENQQNKDFEIQNKDLQDKYDVLKNQETTFEMNNKELNEQLKVLIENNDDFLAQTKVLKDQLQVKHVVIDTHVECHKKYAKLEAERYEYMIRYSAYFDNDKQHRKQIADQEVLKIIIDLEDEVVNLLEKEKANLKTIESLKSKGFELSENAISESENQSENDCQVVEKECHTVVNSKVIAPGMFKLSVSQSVSPISVTKTSCDSKNVENKTKRKRCKRKSSKQNEKQVNNDVSRANSHFVHFLDLDTFSSVRTPKQSSIIWKKKGSSNTSNVDLSSVSHSKLNKDVKRYSGKDLLSCNNSHLGETSCAYVCKDAMNVSCNSRLCDSFDENNLFIFDDESVRISPISKMPFRKKPRDSMNICLWIIDSGCSKHMTGNRALLINFVEKFLETVRFGNNDFAMIAGYGYVVIGSMTIKKVYYVEGLGHNLFSVGQFFDKGLEVAFRKSTCFVRNEDGVDLLTGDRSLNFYTIALNEVASNSSTCLLAKASSSQSWLWHQHLSYLNFTTINNLVKNNLVQDEASDVIISFIKKTQVNLQLQVQRVRTDNGMKFKNKTLAKFLNEIKKSSTMNVETSIVEIPSNEEEVFHESSESFQEESYSSSLNNDVQQSSEEVGVPSSNTQSVSNNMIPNVDEASISHNVFNERLKDAYFDASTSFHDPSNVHTFYQPY